MKQQSVNYRIPVEVRDELKRQAELKGFNMINYLRYLLLQNKEFEQRYKHGIT